MASVRRLTVILAADVAGYSRLMGADEEGTHELLKAHLGELVNPKIGEHRGRIVKNTGDGFLAEFASVIDAVRCAAEVQRGMAERNAGTPPEKRIELRVGINLGDVIAEEHDIFGDGVNLAARLEAYEQALEKDPGLVDAKVGIASVLLSKIANAWSPFARQDLARADQLLLEAIEQNANNAWARCMMGLLRRLQDRAEESLSEWETAIALDRNNATVPVVWTASGEA
jgi:class 3 adenylate cyclase